jgi:uncharacterized repeat protein (TIGR01451 family)
MQKLKFYFISLAALAIFANAVVPFLPAQILPKSLETKTAQAASAGPNIGVKVRDISCSEQEGSGFAYAPGGIATATDSNRKDIDCAAIALVAGNVSTTNSLQSIYSYDFRIGITLAESENGCTANQGSTEWTNWASAGAPNVDTTFNSGITRGTAGMVAADCVRVWYETRAMPEGKAIRDVQLGISVGGGGMRYTPSATSGGGWSDFSRTGDFTSAQVSLITRAIDVPDNASYISTTIPQVATAQYPTGNPSGSTMGTLQLNSAQNYNVVMKNLGGTWDTDTLISRSLGSATPTPPGNNCDGWAPTGPGQTCIENRLMTSSKYKLRRIDNSSGVTTTSGDLPYNKNIQYSYQSQEILDWDCPPPPPPPKGCDIDIEPQALNSLDSIFDSIFNTAHAAECDPTEPEPCIEIPTGTYEAVGPFITPSEDVVYDENATFPLSLTATAAGDSQLRFQMVRTNGAAFGEVAIINVRAGNPWSFTCGVNQTVNVGTNANYVISASVPGGYSNSINVTMASNPAGPALQTSPVVLTSAAPSYTRTATIPTGSLTPQTYTLTFTANDGSSSTTCQATLTVTAPVATVNLRFNGSDGPIGIPPSTGTLSWDSVNASTCTGSMQQGADTSSPAWSGSRATANGGNTQTFNVTGLQQNTTYTFRIICTNQFGQPSTPDSVQVDVSANPSPPTVDIMCMGSDDKDPQDGPCVVDEGASAILTWDSANAVSCSISPDFGAVATSEPSGQSTPNLNKATTYTITCAGSPGAGNASDTVTINTNAVLEPPNAPTISVSNVGCGYIRITANPGAVPPPVDGWVIGWGTSQGNISNTIGGYPTPIPSEYDGSGQTLPLVFYHGTTSTPPAGVPANHYAYNPAAASIGNYYKVAAVNSSSPQHGTNPNNWPTGVTTSNGINLVTCRPDLGLSDKDIIAVGTATNPTSIYSVPGNPCSGAHEVIPNNRIFKNGEVVTYKINACNSGTQALTGVYISDTLENLTYVANSAVASPAGCASAPGVNGSNLSFDLADIAAPASPSTPTVCSITFRATITAPPGSPSALYRFRNTADLNTDQGSKHLLTPYYLFSLGAGVPDRNETPPQ